MFLQRDQSVLWVFHGPLRAQGSNRLLFLMGSISEMNDRPASWANADLEADGKTRAPGAAGQRTSIRLWKPRCNTGPPQGPSRRRAPQAAHSTEAAFGDPARSAPCRMRPVFPLRQIQRRRGPSCGCNSVGVSGRASRGRTGEAMWLWFCNAFGECRCILYNNSIICDLSRTS